MGKPHQDKVWAWVRGERIGRIFAQLPAPEPINFFWTYRYEGDRQLIIGINANAELDVTDADQVAAVLHRHVPEIEEVLEVRGQNWAADPYSRGGNTGYRPGQLTGLLADLQAPWGRVAFARADIASGWVGYMDGAIESGIRAARLARACDDLNAEERPMPHVSAERHCLPWAHTVDFSQAVVTDAELVFSAGQGPFGADGALVGIGDPEAQIRQTFTEPARRCSNRSARRSRPWSARRSTWRGPTTSRRSRRCGASSSRRRSRRRRRCGSTCWSPGC